ncbi:MAG: hemolysin III family protein [Candidatus Edwardsbacteria bacterium]|jgi:hemolysin III|nr:hemolysin III family protein [Candidatus Edwardsbacteria bacterium]
MDDVERYTPGEEVTNAILHGVGLGLAIAALAVLVVMASLSGNAWHIVSFSVYGATLVLLYLSSTLYHGLYAGRAKRLFRVFDHSAIFLLIAGTYTPITLITLRGKLGWAVFGTVWGIAVAGIVAKAFWAHRFPVLSTVLYLAMGWVVVVAIKPLLANLNTVSLVFLAVGGLFYTLGTAFYLWHRLKFHHAIWHLFVLAGSICHFFTVLFLLPRD